MQRIRSVGVLSLAKILALIYAAMGLLLAPFFLLMGALGSMMQPDAKPFGMVGSVALAIISPFLYGAIGFVSGAAGALIYNLIAGWLGGVEIELEPSAGAVLAAADTTAV